MGSPGVTIHQTAEVSPGAAVGAGTRVWNEAQVREGAQVGRDCILAKGVYVDADVVVGDRVKLENRVSLFRGARLGSGVFVGPHSCLLNDKRPRATTLGGRPQRESESIGSGCTVLPGVHMGRFAMVGAGAVVTRDVPDHGLVVGTPARLVGYVCECGCRLQADGTCASCGGRLETMAA